MFTLLIQLLTIWMQCTRRASQVVDQLKMSSLLIPTLLVNNGVSNKAMLGHVGFKILFSLSCNNKSSRKTSEECWTFSWLETFWWSSRIALHPKNITNVQSKMSSASPGVNWCIKGHVCTSVMAYLYSCSKDIVVGTLFFFIGLQHENMENKWSLFTVLTQTFDLDALHPNNLTNIQSNMSSTSPVVV